MKACGGMEVYLLAFLTSALDESEREESEIYYNTYYFGRENQMGRDYFGSLGVNETLQSDNIRRRFGGMYYLPLHG
jgi:hypothetical protein